MIEQKQRDILFEACKKIATHKNCPAWIETIIRNAVAEAKSIKEEFEGFDTPVTDLRPFEIGDVCKSNRPNDKCKYKIISEHDPIEGIRLFTIQILEGDINNPVGLMVPNVPETFLVRC